MLRHSRAQHERHEWKDARRQDGEQARGERKSERGNHTLSLVPFPKGQMDLSSCVSIASALVVPVERAISLLPLKLMSVLCAVTPNLRRSAF